MAEIVECFESKWNELQAQVLELQQAAEQQQVQSLQQNQQQQQPAAQPDVAALQARIQELEAESAG